MSGQGENTEQQNAQQMLEKEFLTMNVNELKSSGKNNQNPKDFNFNQFQNFGFPQGMQGMPNMPNFAQMANMPNMQGMPNMPGMPNMQNMAQMMNMGMPGFPMPGMFPMQPQATPPNLINQPFIHLTDYTDDTAIRAAFPAAHSYNDPKFELDTTKGAEFFILRSSCDDDIHKAIKYGIWTSSFRNNQTLHNGFMQAKKSGTPIYAFYTVVNSEQYAGVAQITGDPDFQKSFNYWWEEGKWNGLMSVKWLYIKDIPYRHFEDVQEGDKMVTSLRDGTKITFENGMKMLKIFKEAEVAGNIFEAFEFMDDREEKLRLTRDVAQNMYSKMNPGQMDNSQSQQQHNHHHKKPYHNNNYNRRGGSNMGGYKKPWSNNDTFYRKNNYHNSTSNNSDYYNKDKLAQQSGGSTGQDGSSQKQDGQQVNRSDYKDRGYGDKGGNYRDNRDRGDTGYGYKKRYNNNSGGGYKDRDTDEVPENTIDIQIKKKTKQSSMKKKGSGHAGHGGKKSVEYERKDSQQVEMPGDDDCEYTKKEAEVAPKVETAEVVKQE